MEDAARGFGHHEVGAVRRGDRGHNVGLLHTGTHQHALVEALALQRGAVEVAAQIRKRLGLAVHHAHVGVVRRQHGGKLRAYATAPHDDDIDHGVFLLVRLAPSPEMKKMRLSASYRNL